MMVIINDVGNPTERILCFEELKNREYLLLDKIYMEDCPPRTWRFVISNNTVVRITYQRTVGKSRSMKSMNVSKNLRTMLLLMGISL